MAQHRRFKAFIIAALSLKYKERITKRGRCHVEMKKPNRFVMWLLGFLYDVRTTMAGRVHIELRPHNREGKIIQ